MTRALYRSRQVLHALRPRIDAEDLGFARQHLSPTELHLFDAMEKRDQRHALEVAGRLRAQGIEIEPLLTAALLHDCGKGAVPVWLRIAQVLRPSFVKSAARPDDTGWHGAAYRLANHVEIGADAATQAGNHLLY